MTKYDEVDEAVSDSHANREVCGPSIEAGRKEAGAVQAEGGVCGGRSRMIRRRTGTHESPRSWSGRQPKASMRLFFIGGGCLRNHARSWNDGRSSGLLLAPFLPGFLPPLAEGASSFVGESAAAACAAATGFASA